MSVVVDLFNEFVSRREFYCCATLSTFPSKNTFPRTYIIHKLLFKHVDVSIIDNFSLIFLCLFHYYHNFPFPSHLLGCASWPRSIISKIQCFSLKKKMKIQMKNKAYFLFILKIECFSFMYFLIVQWNTKFFWIQSETNFCFKLFQVAEHYHLSTDIICSSEVICEWQQHLTELLSNSCNLIVW